jgi:hypothetical protein
MENTASRIVFRIVAGLVLLAAIAGIGFFAYQAGVANGSPITVQSPSGGTAPGPYPYYGYGFWHPFPFFGFGFGCFGLLIPLFLLFLAFGAFRRMLWGPRWGWRHMGHHGPWGEHGEGVPSMFAEWHKRAHGGGEQSEEKKE